MTQPTNNTFVITGGRASTISNSKNGNTAYSDTLKGFDFIQFIRERLNVTFRQRFNNDGLIEWSNNGNPRKKIYLDKQEGKRMQDIWEFKDPDILFIQPKKMLIY